MRDQSEIWRQRLWIWLPALLFFMLAERKMVGGLAGSVKG